MTEKPSSGIDRRTVLKGVAWSAPAVAVALAAPAASASTPPCPTCIEPGVIGGVTFNNIIIGNKGTMNLTGALGLDATSCDLTLFKPVYTSIVTSATLTMSDGSTYAGSGLGSGSGTFGQIGALPGSFNFSGVNFPDGLYALNSGPVHPTKVSVSVTLVLIGLPGLVTVNCPINLEWNVSVWGAGAVVAGFGTIPFAGTVSAA